MGQSSSTKSQAFQFAGRSAAVAGTSTCAGAPAAPERSSVWFVVTVGAAGPYDTSAACAGNDALNSSATELSGRVSARYSPSLFSEKFVWSFPCGPVTMFVPVVGLRESAKTTRYPPPGMLVPLGKVD